MKTSPNANRLNVLKNWLDKRKQDIDNLPNPNLTPPRRNSLTVRGLRFVKGLQA